MTTTASTIDQPESAGTRVLVSLCALVFISSLSAVALLPFLVEIARDLNTTVPLLGQVTTVSVIFGALIGLVAGPLADHYGPRRLLLAGVVSLTFSAVGVILAGSLSILLLIRLLTGIGMAILPGVSLAIAGSQFHGDERRKAMSWTVAAIPSPTIIGMPVVAVIGDLAGWRYAFGLVAGVSLASLFLVRVALPADAPIPVEPFRMRTIMNSYRPLLHHLPTLTIFGASVLRALCWIGSLTYISAYLIEEKGLSVSGFGAMAIVFGVGYVAGSRFGCFDLRTLCGISTAIMALMMALIYTLPFGIWPIVPLFLTASFVAGMGWVALTTLLVSQTPATAATTMVFNWAIFNLGSGLGSLIGGIVLATGGYSAIGVVLPAFAVIAAVLIWQPGWWFVSASGRPSSVE